MSLTHSILPALDRLPMADASDLASIAEAAAIAFKNQEDAAKAVLSKHPTGDWRLKREHELADATRLRTIAHDLHRMALARERLADRERCRAIRAVQAFARAAMGGCAWCGNSPVIINLDSENLCQSCANKWARAEGMAAAEHAAEGRAAVAA